MRLLITGASGFIGRALVERLAAAGDGGVVTGRTPPAGVPRGWHAVSRDEVLGDGVECRGIDAIIHLEVRQHVTRPTPADVRSFWDANVLGTRQWLQWADRNHVRRFVFTSSIKAVAAADNAERVAVIDCADFTGGEPDMAYGRSKAWAECAVCEWAAARPERIAVILRPAPVYGPGHGANLAAFARQVVAGRPCLIGSSDARKSVVSRTNLIAAIAFAAAWDTPGCDVFNVSDRDTVSIGRLADMIATLANAPRPKRIPEAAARLVALIGDALGKVSGLDCALTTARMKQLLSSSEFPSDKLIAAGFRHPQTTEQGLQEMVQWMIGRSPACLEAEVPS